MGIPNTSGIERANIKDMIVGDYIKVQAVDYDNWLLGSEVSATNEMPMVGYSFSAKSDAYTQYFYMLKVAKGLLIADRLLFRKVSWDKLNSERLIEGRTLTNKPFAKIRSLTGGICYGVKGLNEPSLTPVEGPAYPNENEWDKYVVKNSEWFYLVNSPTWCMETPKIGTIINKSPGQKIISNNERRTARGSSLEFTPQLDTDWLAPGSLSPGSDITSVGFRPVFTYCE